MSFRKPCHMPFRKLIPPFTLTDQRQKLIPMADKSDYGWKQLVNTLITSLPTMIRTLRK